LAPTVKVVITGFRFASLGYDADKCDLDIRAGEVDLKYKFNGLPPVNIKTPGPKDPPPKFPPAKEDDANPNYDPVRKLIDNGWKPTDWFGGVIIGQPTGFGIGRAFDKKWPPAGKKNPYFPPGEPWIPIIRKVEFESLDLTFTFPMFCLCTAAPGNCKVRKFKMKIEYSGKTFPKVDFFYSQEKNCSQALTLKPTNKVPLKQMKLSHPPQGAMGNQYEFSYTGKVKCTCPNQRGKASSCEVDLITEFTFEVRVNK